MDVKTAVCQPETEVDDSASTASSENTKFLNENAPLLGSSHSSSTTESSNPNMNSGSTTSEHSVEDKTERNSSKRKQGKVIASRYKQAAIKYSAQKCTIPKAGTSKYSPLLYSNRKVPGTAKKGNKAISSEKLSSIVSTPAFNLSSLPAPVHDASSIIADQSCAPPPSCKKQLGLDLTKTGVKSKLGQRKVFIKKPLPFPSLPECASNETKAKEKKQYDDSVSDIEMRNIYCEYLQALALESMAQESLEERSKDAMTQMYGLWKVNDSLTKELAGIESELQAVLHMQQLQEFLDRQDQDLSSLVSVLKDVHEKYQSLAEGLDKVRHQLPTKNILVPSSGKEDEIYGPVLDETTAILKSLMGSVEPMCSDADLLANESKSLTHTIEAEIKALQKCEESVSMLKRMTLCESSLRIQQLQSSSEEDNQSWVLD